VSQPERVWTPEPYRPEDFPAIVAMVRAYYGDIETSREDFLRWMYESNPSGKVHLWIARHRESGDVIGMHVLLPMHASVDGEDAASALSFHALVDPTYHRQGIWSGLGDACHDAAIAADCRFSFGVPNPNSHAPMVKRLAYQSLGDLDLFVHVVRPGPVIESSLSGPVASMGRVGVTALRPVLFRRGAARGGWTVRELRAFDDRFDAVYADFRRRHRVLVRRDAAHLNWRYTGVPGRSYRIFAACRGTEVAAYAVLRHTEFRGVDSGILMDLGWAGPEGPDAALAGLNHGVDALTADGAAAFFAFNVPGNPAGRILQRGGFRRPPGFLLPQPFPLLYRPLAGREDDPAGSLRHWYFTIGDYDVF
jgi:hypothetical protein